jgi:hypothetical protein
MLPSTRQLDCRPLCCLLIACVLLASASRCSSFPSRSPSARFGLQHTIMTQLVCYLLSAACCIYVRSAANDASQSVACFQALCDVFHLLRQIKHIMFLQKSRCDASVSALSRYCCSTLLSQARRISLPASSTSVSCQGLLFCCAFMSCKEKRVVVLTAFAMVRG